MGDKSHIIPRDQVVFHAPTSSLLGQPVAAPVKMAVIAGFYLVELQKVYDLLADIALIEGGIVKEAELFRLPAAFSDVSSRRISR